MFADGHRLNAEGFYYWTTRHCTDTMTVLPRQDRSNSHSSLVYSTSSTYCTRFSTVSCCTNFLTIWSHFNLHNLKSTNKVRLEQLIDFPYLHIKQHTHTHIYIYIYIYGDRGSTVVKVLCSKSEDRWFDPSWCHWNFIDIKSFRSHYGHGVDSSSNRNEYQEQG